MESEGQEEADGEERRKEEEKKAQKGYIWDGWRGELNYNQVSEEERREPLTTHTTRSKSSGP